MGDRALVLFANAEMVSPTTYLHWAGGRVPDFLSFLQRELAHIEEHMAGRKDDVEYTSARFVGICHYADSDSNLSLGIWNTPQDIKNAIRDYIKCPADSVDKDEDFGEMKKLLCAYSNGDAGAILVILPEFECYTFGGYLEENLILKEPGYDL